MLLLCIIAWPATGFSADDSGMSLEVLADQAHPDLKYVLGEPIKIIMVMKNRSDWPINTERAFKEVQLENALMITDPGGTRHSLCGSKREGRRSLFHPGDPAPGLHSGCHGEICRPAG